MWSPAACQWKKKCVGLKYHKRHRAPISCFPAVWRKVDSHVPLSVLYAWLHIHTYSACTVFTHSHAHTHTAPSPCATTVQPAGHLLRTANGNTYSEPLFSTSTFKKSHISKTYLSQMNSNSYTHIKEYVFAHKQNIVVLRTSYKDGNVSTLSVSYLTSFSLTE